VYEARQHRNSPAVMSHKDDPDHSFYQDQYKEREKRFAMEREEARKLEREKELAARQHLEKEVTAMEDVLKQNRK
jgi:primosomal protein N''